MEKFDVGSVELNKKILVEASAGTGKTFSIAALVLRLVVEQDVPINKMLLVTFTNDAVEELQTRIRKFLTEAYAFLKNEKKPSEEIIETILAKDMVSKEEKIRRAQTSAVLLDEANIMTIHGFAQRMLNDYAFETKQDFGAELVKSIDEFVEDVCNEFWRKEVTLLSPDVLHKINDLPAFKNSLPGFVMKILDGSEYFVGGENIGDVENEIIQAKQNIEDAKGELYKTVISLRTEIEEKNTNPTSVGLKKLFDLKELSDDEFVEPFLNIIDNGNTKKTVVKLFDTTELEAKKSNYDNALKKYIELINSIKIYLKKKLALNYVHKIPIQIKQARKLTFDDMVRNFKNAVEENKKLVEMIQSQYDAVFIDEFQDTDKTQFEIFANLFLADGYEKTVFLIGDPKQSIYAFRGADVDSYLEAKNNILPDNRFTMKENFRSSKKMVGETNDFYDLKGLNQFGFGQNNKIEYIPVESSKEAGIVGVDKSLEFFKFKNKNTLTQDVATYIYNQINNKEIFIPVSGGKMRNLIPGDFAILTRTKFDWPQIKAELAGLNIPAVMRSDENVLQTIEKNDIVLLMKAMLEPSIRNIKNALFLSFIKKDAAYVEWLDDDQQIELIDRFTNYGQLLRDKSLYQAFDKLFLDYNLYHSFSHTTIDLRIITNARHIVELANEEIVNNGRSPEEVLLWLTNGTENNGDYEIQMESDEDAVKVSTIHSSKGLEYNWVIVLGMDGAIEESRQHYYSNFKLDGKKQFADFKNLGSHEELFKEQLKQEMARQLYVAITRAKFKCDFFVSNSNIHKSILKDFIWKLPETFTESFNLNDNGELDSTEPAAFQSLQLPSNLYLSISNWRKQSYSKIAEHKLLRNIPPVEYALNEAYDKFIFQELGRGKHIGDRLHKVLENLPFDHDYSSIEISDEAIKKQLESFNKKSPKHIDNSDHIRNLMCQVMNAEIKVEGARPFQLKNVQPSKRLVELEFNFDMLGDRAEVEALLQQHNFPYNFTGSAAFEGLMNGKIDLFFEHDGQYFILDWKSNHLGNSLGDYKQEQLSIAMEESGYTVQYLLYTLAVYKFLKSHLSSFEYNRNFGGAIYVFLRGVRKDGGTGIYTVRPAKELIEGLDALLRNKKLQPIA